MDQIKYFVNAKSDGLILLACSYSLDKTILEEIQKESKIKIISVLRDLSLNNIQSFAVDYRTGAREATEHLMDIGREKIAVILGPDIYKPDNHDRFDGVIETLTEYNIQLDTRYIVKEIKGGWSPHVGFHNMNKLLALDPIPNALISFDDVTAFGAIRAIYDKGFRVPEDIAVIGFDDLLVSEYYNPPLTTVSYPIDQMALAAVSHLTQDIKNEIKSTPNCVYFNPKLIIRKSTNSIRQV